MKTNLIVLASIFLFTTGFSGKGTSCRNPKNSEPATWFSFTDKDTAATAWFWDKGALQHEFFVKDRHPQMGSTTLKSHSCFDAQGKLEYQILYTDKGITFMQDGQIHSSFSYGLPVSTHQWTCTCEPTEYDYQLEDSTGKTEAEAKAACTQGQHAVATSCH